MNLPVVANNDKGLLAPSFLKDILAYSPRHEYLLAAAYLLKAAGTGEDLKHFWAFEADPKLLKERDAIDELYYVLELLGRDVADFFETQYEVTPGIARAIESGVKALFTKILEYFKSVSDTVETYVEAGFFDQYESLEQSVPIFAQLAWGTNYRTYIDFAQVVICDYYIRKDLTVPRLSLKTDQDQFNLEPSDIRDAVLSYLIDFWNVAPTKRWGDHDPRLVGNDCLHLGALRWVNQMYECCQCGDPLSDEEAHNMFYGSTAGTY